MKKIKNKIAALVCGLVLLAGSITVANAAYAVSGGVISNGICTIWYFQGCNSTASGVCCFLDARDFIADSLAWLLSNC
jgi:hypothetical protein